MAALIQSSAIAATMLGTRNDLTSARDSPTSCLRFEDDLCEGGVAVMRDAEGDVFYA